MAYKGINHVGLVVTNKARSEHFLRDVLGLQQHTRIPSWYLVGSCAIHLIEISSAGTDDSLYHEIQHVAIQVDNLREVLSRLLGAALEPYQMDFEGEVKEITSQEDDLSFGIGTIFVADPDGNLFEFIQLGHGVFAGEPDPFK